MVDFAKVVTNTLFWVTRDQGAPDQIYLRDPRYAAEFFGLRDTTLLRTPRGKFLFFVNFLRPENVGFNRYGDPQLGIPFLVKEIQRPAIQFETETLNQYNKKRVIQKRLDYSPISVTFYDTYDQRVMDMVRDYLRFYYGDFGPTVGQSSWNYDVTAEEFQHTDGANSDWGFRPPTANPNQAYFFNRVEFYQYGYNVLNKFSIINPKIASFDYDNQDYSSQDPQTITLSLIYEGIVFEGNQIAGNQTEFGQFSNTLSGVAPVTFPGEGAANPVKQPSFGDQLAGEFLGTLGDIATGQITPGQALEVAEERFTNPFFWTSKLPPIRFNRQERPTVGGFNPNAPVNAPVRSTVLGSTSLSPVSSGINMEPSAQQRKRNQIRNGMNQSSTLSLGKVVEPFRNATSTVSRWVDSIF